MSFKTLRTLFTALVFATGAMMSVLRASADDHAAGFIQVKQIDGVWWFISPEGEKFVSLGVNHIEPHLWLAPYNRAVILQRYGDDMVDATGRFDTTSNAAQKWIDRQVEICRDLHFNTFGKHTHPSISSKLYRDQIYYVAAFETSPAARWHLQGGEGPLPDIFTRDFAAAVQSRITEVVMEHKDSRNLLGYYITDIPAWELPDYAQRQEEEFVMIYPWVSALLKLGVTSPGKQRWIKHLQTRYDSAEKAAEVWGLPISPLYGTTWGKLARQQRWFEPKEEAKARSDMKSFIPAIADRWYGLHHAAVRKLDQNHLILGDKNRVEMDFQPLVPALKKYVDVVVVQSYNPWSKDAARVEELYRLVGKPIFNGDGSFAFVHPRQSKLLVKGHWTGAKDMNDVVSMYRSTLEGMMSRPYMIGWHHCGMLQQWDEAERGDVDSNENGFMDPFENYYTQWTDVIREVNGAAKGLHANSSE